MSIKNISSPKSITNVMTLKENIANESSIYFKFALKTIDYLIAEKNQINITTTINIDDNIPITKSKTELLDMKIKVQLYMAYCLQEMNQCDQAIAYIKLIETDAKQRTIQRQEEIGITIKYAKFMIYIKNDDIKLAEAYLKDIINNTSSYDTAIDVISLYLKSNKNNEIVHNSKELFGMLSYKFPNDPEYTQTRIMHLKYILCNSHCDKNAPLNGNNKNINKESDRYDNLAAIELCYSIINDHANGKNILIGDNLIKISKILHDQYKYYYCNENWKLTTTWANIYLKLASTDSMNEDDLLPVYLHITGNYNIKTINSFIIINK